MIDQLGNADLKKLRDECKVHPASNNFEQICRILITGFAMVIDEAVKAKKAAVPKT